MICKLKATDLSRAAIDYGGSSVMRESQNVFDVCGTGANVADMVRCKEMLCSIIQVQSAH
jgi:hypothetical protein